MKNSWLNYRTGFTKNNAFYQCFRTILFLCYQYAYIGFAYREKRCGLSILAMPENINACLKMVFRQALVQNQTKRNIIFACLQKNYLSNGKLFSNFFSLITSLGIGSAIVRPIKSLCSAMSQIILIVFSMLMPSGS